MRMFKLWAVLAVLGMAVAPALGQVTLQWSDFEVGTNYGQGPVGENMVAPAGYGPPTTYSLDGTILTTGNTSQNYNVPSNAVNDVFGNPGEGWMIPDDGGGAFDSTDWDDFIVNTLGGPAPDPNSYLKFIADVRIDAEVPSLWTDLKWFPLHNAPNSSFVEFDPAGNANHDFGVWEQDVVFLETEFDGTGQADFILILVSKFEALAPQVGDVNFYLDNVRVEYLPEPTALALFGLGGIALLRRRR